MNTYKKNKEPLSLLERLRKPWFPPTAALGAVAAFSAAACQPPATEKVIAKSAEPASSNKSGEQAVPSNQSYGGLERAYIKSATLVGSSSAHAFRRCLAGIAVGSGDRIYALGDDEVRVFESSGRFLKGWKVLQNATCLAVDPAGRVYIGAHGRVEIHDGEGSRIGGFAAGEKDKPAKVTAIKVLGEDILVADAAARFIRRYDFSGRQLGIIGNQNKTGHLMLPNGWLDIDINPEGVILATDTGRHLVTAWAMDGSPLGSFGKFGMSDPADFVGCCNPVNLAFTPDGKVVTAEKMVARVKVYETAGKLLAVIGSEHFDPDCVNIHLAVDSKGRIVAADPVRREIKLFSPQAATTISESASPSGAKIL